MDLSTLHLLVNLHHLHSGRINLDDIIKRNLLEQNVRHSLGGITSILKPIPRSCDDTSKGVKRPNMENEGLKGSSSQLKFGKALLEEMELASSDSYQKMVGSISRQDGNGNQYRLQPTGGSHPSEGCDISFRKPRPPQLMNTADQERNFPNSYKNLSKSSLMGPSTTQSLDIQNRILTSPLNLKFSSECEKNIYKNHTIVSEHDINRTEHNLGHIDERRVPTYDTGIELNYSRDISYSDDDSAKVNLASSRTSGEFAQDFVPGAYQAAHRRFEVQNENRYRIRETTVPSNLSIVDTSVGESSNIFAGGILRHSLNTRKFISNAWQCNDLLDLPETSHKSTFQHSRHLSDNHGILHTAQDFSKEHIPHRPASVPISSQINHTQKGSLDDQMKEKYIVDNQSSQVFQWCDDNRSNRNIPNDGRMTECGQSGIQDMVGANSSGKYQIPVPLDSNSKLSTGIEEMESIITSLMGAQTFFQSPPFIQNKQKLREKHTNYIQSLKEQTTSTSEPPNCDEQAKAELTWLTGFVENTVITMIKFAKHVPGFKKLCLQDQAKLLKCSKSESLLCGGMICFDQIHGIMTMPDGHHCKVYNLAKTLSKEFVERKIEMIAKLDALILSEKETAVLRAITIVFPDRCVLEDRSKVKVIYKKLVDCIIYEVKAHYVDVGERVKKIFDLLNFMKDISALQRPSILRAFESEGVLESKPLIAEFIV